MPQSNHVYILTNPHYLDSEAVYTLRDGSAVLAENILYLDALHQRCAPMQPGDLWVEDIDLAGAKVFDHTMTRLSRPQEASICRLYGLQQSHT